MSFYTMAFLGTTPIGSLIAGSVATHLGPLRPYGCLLGAFVFARHLPALREMVRPIYTHLGLIQADTLRTQTATDACLH